MAQLPLRAWLTEAWRAGVQSSWEGRGALNYLTFLKAWLPLCRYGLDPLFFYYLPRLAPGSVSYPLGFDQWSHQVCRGTLSGVFLFSASLQQLSLPKPGYLPEPL